MPDTAITIDRLQALQVALHIAAQIAFDLDFVVRDRVNDLVQLLRRQLFRPQIRVDVRLLQNPLGCAQADSINVSKRRLDALLCWNFNSK